MAENGLTLQNGAQVGLSVLGGVTANHGALKKPCFPAGTLVSTRDGLRPIESIQKADEVWAFDVRDGRWKLRPVLETYVRDNFEPLVIVSVAGQRIETTQTHPFYVTEGEDLEGRPPLGPTHDVPHDAVVPGRWVCASDLRVGDVVILKDARPAAIDAIEEENRNGIVYNFHVDELNCYAVSAKQVLVHNDHGAVGGGAVRKKPVNLPSIKKVSLNIEHVASGHMKGGSRVSKLKDLFPDAWNRDQVSKAIYEAYRTAKRIATQGDRILLQGTYEGKVIEMWFNKATMTIETAYPKGWS